MVAGERIYNIERYFNNQAGFGGDDDSLPQRFLEEPASGPAAGHVLRTRPDEGAVLRRARLGRRRRPRGQAARTRNHRLAHPATTSGVEIRFYATLRPLVGGRSVQLDSSPPTVGAVIDRLIAPNIPRSRSDCSMRAARSVASSP